jgi:hypothetical protein
MLGAGQATGANTVPVVPDLLTLATPGYAETAVVTVTLSIPHARRGQAFPVMVDAGDGAMIEVGQIAMFGHGMPHGAMTFSLPFGPALDQLRQRGSLKAKRILRFTASNPSTSAHVGMTGMAPADIPVQSVVIDGG